MAFAHSKGQDFNNDLLHYTNCNTVNNDNTLNDEKSIKTAYELQKRLANFWKNNQLSVLLKSQKYSGEVSYNNEPEPLGGPINSSEEGEEFPFWELESKSSNTNEDKNEDTNEDTNEDKNEDTNEDTNEEDKKNNVTNNNVKEKFSPLDVKEEFNGGTIVAIIGVILLIIAVIVTQFINFKL